MVALVLLAAAAQAQVIPFCESSITRPKIVGCTECLSTSKSCFYCSHKKSPIWTGSPAKLTEVSWGRRRRRCRRPGLPPHRRTHRRRVCPFAHPPCCSAAT